MASQNDLDLLPEETAGFKVGEKKTLNEIQNMGEWPIYLFSRIMHVREIGPLYKNLLLLAIALP